ncbi:MAG TPA: glycosyltransferase family 4 protein [Bacteroidetes bacterium]|nr:glycosyltransferase family 4 protein [Candidatus Limimorpha avicola]
MKILFFPAYFTPEHVASSYLGKNRNQAFADAGFEMLLYSPIPTRGVNDEIRKEYKKFKRNEMLYDGKMIVHRFSLMKEKKNPLTRALRYAIQCIKQFYFGVFSKDALSCDLMFISSTPPIQGAMAALIKKFNKIPVIYNLQDIFPDSLVGTGLAKKDGLLWKIGRVIENFTYRNVDKIIVISEDFKRNIIAKGVPEEKIEVIYNWVDENAVVPIAKKDNPIFDELNIDRNLFHVVYAGNLGHAQNVQVLLEAAKELKDKNSIEFLIFGTGGLKNEYESFVINNALKNVRFFPLQPMEKVSQVYSLADASVVSCKKGLGGSAMPSKTWNILSAGTSVLCSFDGGGDLQRIIEDNNVGLFSEAGDHIALCKNILKLFNNRSMCEEYGRNGRNFILNNLTKEIGTSKYVQIIKQFDK